MQRAILSRKGISGISLCCRIVFGVFRFIYDWFSFLFFAPPERFLVGSLIRVEKGMSIEVAAQLLAGKRNSLAARIHGSCAYFRRA